MSKSVNFNPNQKKIKLKPNTQKNWNKKQRRLDDLGGE